MFLCRLYSGTDKTAVLKIDQCFLELRMRVNWLKKGEIQNNFGNDKTVLIHNSFGKYEIPCIYQKP